MMQVLLFKTQMRALGGGLVIISANQIIQNALRHPPLMV